MYEDTVGKSVVYWYLHYFLYQVCSVYSGIKKYIVGLIIKTSSDAAMLEKEKVYVGKLNMILVQVCNLL
jgi:hypothetical protein